MTDRQADCGILAFSSTADLSCHHPRVSVFLCFSCSMSVMEIIPFSVFRIVVSGFEVKDDRI